jgi:cellulose synthase/poly-beta-1,6-N-acetylglucosamine synthase-like glycosyltransferase
MFEIPLWIIYCIFFLEFFVSFSFLALYVRAKLKSSEILPIKNFPEVTFVIPAYNCSNILNHTVDSIKQLDYPPNKIDILIVNDASTDNTLEVAKKLAKKYSRIIVLTKKHGGKADSVNFGIKKSKTKLICVLDSDTLLKEDILKKAILLFNKPSVVAVATRFKALNNDRFIERMQNVEYAITGFYRDIMGKSSALPLTPAFTVFKKEFFEKHGYFDVDNLTEDFEMGLKIQSNHYDINYVSDSYAITEVPNTFRKFFRQRLRWGYGTLHNYDKYKSLFFKKDYGDLGVFILPIWFLGMLISSFILLLGVYVFIQNSIEFIQKLLVGWLPTFSFNFSHFIWSLLDLRVLLTSFSIILGLLLFLFIRYELRENIRLKDYILFILIYLWLLALTSIWSLGYFIRGKKPNW